MRTLRLLTCCLLAGAAVSCTSPAAPAPTGDPSATGVIVARDVSISIGGPPTMHVKDPIDEECGVIYLLRSSTPVFRRTSGGRTTAASAADLTVGRRVGVWTDLVLDSCPGQAEAKAVVLLE